MTEFYQKQLTNKCSYVIIQVRKFACKGFRAQYFNGNGDLTKTKRMATAVADKILFCHVSML